MNRFLAVFFPPKCPYCSKAIRYDQTECIVCRAGFPKMPRIALLPTGEICIAPFTYNTNVRKAMLEYKFRGRKFNSESFASALAYAINTVYTKDMTFEVITCVPMSSERKKVRGFNQSELIAKNAARILGKPFEQLLYRDKGAAVQHELSYHERINNKDNTFHAIHPEKIKGRKILLIDDIMTSGMTLSACCGVLKENGADRILCSAVAMHKGNDSGRCFRFR